MYQITTLQEKVRVPPDRFGEDLKKTVRALLREQYEGQLSKELGLVVAVTDVEQVGEGLIHPGDGAAHYNTTFKALTFKPELNEIVQGKVIEIVEFGAFVSLGALDGLVHVSQVTDDFLSYDEKGRRLVGKESKKSLSEGDLLRAKIVALSLKKSQNQKVGLSMRQSGLGKLQWVEDGKKKSKGTGEASTKKKSLKDKPAKGKK